MPGGRARFSVTGRAKRGAGGGEAPKRRCFPCLSAFAVRSYPQVGLARVGVNIGYRICVTGLEVASKPLNIRLFSRSEEHTSELQSLMRISYAVFCLKKKTHTNHFLVTQYSIRIIHNTL